MSSRMRLRRSPKPGALMATQLSVPRRRLSRTVARASPSTSSATTNSGRPERMTSSSSGTMSWMLLIFWSVSRMYGSFEHGLHLLHVRGHVGRDVTAVVLHAFARSRCRGRTFWLSSTEMAPSLPTASMASAIFSPISASPAEMVPTLAICSLVDTSSASALMASDHHVGGLLDAAADAQGVGAGGHVAQVLRTRWRRQAASAVGGAVAGHVVGLSRPLRARAGRPCSRLDPPALLPWPRSRRRS